VSNPNEEILAYLTNSPSSSFGGQAVEIVRHWAGSANLLWRVAGRIGAQGQEAVLKLYLDAGQVRSRREYDGQLLFAPYGLAPQPLWLDRIPETLPRSVVVYRWVEGEPFNATDPGQWTALARAAAQVHAAPVEGMDRFSPQPVNLSYFWSVLGASLPPLAGWLLNHRLGRLAELVSRLHGCGQRVVEAALPLWDQPPTPVHGDLRPENVLNSFGAPVLLDWEMFGLGDAALEAARLLHEQRRAAPPNALDEWLDAYLGASVDSAAAARIEVYRRLLPLQDAAYLLSGGMKLSPEERRSPELQENVPHLAAALQSALGQALIALGAGAIHEEESVAAECAALFAQESSA